LKDFTPAGLIVQWRELAEMLRAEGCPEVAAARERCASELETSLRKCDNEALSVNQAASESGYSAEYLRRVLRYTPALNAGRAGKPLILRRVKTNDRWALRIAKKRYAWGGCYWPNC
jgi:hypothetical protein